nr:hypothetical protein [Hoylesella loescheii]
MNVELKQTGKLRSWRQTIVVIQVSKPISAKYQEKRYRRTQSGKEIG